MNIDQIKTFVTEQLKSYKVTHLLKEWEDTDFFNMYEQLTRVKPWEAERRLIDYACMELNKFRYILYAERHYEDLLFDKACIECLRCENACCIERRYYVKQP